MTTIARITIISSRSRLISPDLIISIKETDGEGVFGEVTPRPMISYISSLIVFLFLDVYTPLDI